MQIGSSQRIQLDWLEYPAALVLAEQTRDQIETALQAFLCDKLSVGGTASRGNREHLAVHWGRRSLRVALIPVRSKCSYRLLPFSLFALHHFMLLIWKTMTDWNVSAKVLTKIWSPYVAADTAPGTPNLLSALAHVTMTQSRQHPGRKGHRSPPSSRGVYGPDH
jgi:hypothetical protein